jgi:uncharacterized protein YsxB (DUF464 family)
MTTLTVEWEGAKIRRLTVSGHAGFAQSGRDVVCAAASVLITTGVNALESVAGIEPEVWQDEKAAVISLSLPGSLSDQAMHDAQIILRTIRRGFEDIAEAYPKHMKIIDGRKSSC